jgi:hypothetical protein
MPLGTAKKKDRNLFPVRKSQSRSTSKGQSPAAGEKDRKGHNNTRKEPELQRDLA